MVGMAEYESNPVCKMKIAISMLCKVCHSNKWFKTNINYKSVYRKIKHINREVGVRPLHQSAIISFFPSCSQRTQIFTIFKNKIHYNSALMSK